MKSNPFSTPEGYFSQLKTKLESIPSPNDSATPFINKISPYFYIAAVMVSAFVIVSLLTRSPSSDHDTKEDIILNYAYFTSNIDADYIFEDYQEDESYSQITEEELQEYLINSKISVEELTYIASYEK